MASGGHFVQMCTRSLLPSLKAQKPQPPWQAPNPTEGPRMASPEPRDGGIFSVFQNQPRSLYNVPVMTRSVL